MNIPMARRIPLLLVLTAVLAGCVVAPPRGERYPRRERPAPETPVASQALYFYPERGQDAARQDRDRYECYRWAVRQTGVDPGMQPVQRSAEPSDEPVRREGAPVVAGAVTGAAVGGVLSSPRHAGSGMVLGALLGGMLGAAAEENRAQAAERYQDARRRDWEARQAPLDGFRRAMSACMSGRGYAVR